MTSNDLYEVATLSVGTHNMAGVRTVLRSLNARLKNNRHLREGTHITYDHNRGIVISKRDNVPDEVLKATLDNYIERSDFDLRIVRFGVSPPNHVGSHVVTDRQSAAKDGSISNQDYKALYEATQSAVDQLRGQVNEMRDANEALEFRVEALLDSNRGLRTEAGRQKQDRVKAYQELARIRQLGKAAQHPAQAAAVENGTSEIYERIASSGINESFVADLKRLESPRLEALVKKYETLMEPLKREQGFDSERLREAIKYVRTPFERTAEYKELLPHYKGAVEAVQSVGELRQKNPFLTVEVNPEAQAIISRMDALRKQYEETSGIVQQFREAFRDAHVHYLLTSSTEGSGYKISLTLPIQFRNPDEGYKTLLENMLVSHVHDELLELNEKVNGNVERVNNNGMVQYDFKVPESSASPQKLRSLQRILREAIFNSQINYVFSQLGLRIDIVSETNTDGLPLEDKVDAPRTVIADEQLNPRQAKPGCYRGGKEVPRDILQYYALLAAQARELGYNISDDPRQFLTHIREPKTALLVPALAIAIGNSEDGVRRSDILKIVPELMPPDLAEYFRKALTPRRTNPGDTYIKILTRNEQVSTVAAGIYRQNPQVKK